MNIINLSAPAGVSSPVAECGAVMIGYVGEGGVTQVVLDFSAWAEAYGDGVITLGIQRSGDPSWYPVALDVDGTSAAWLVSKLDTSVEGMGVARFSYTVGGAEKRSALWNFFVDRGLQSPEGEAPDPYEDWVETLTGLGAETLQNAQDARAAAEAAEASAENAGTAAEAAGDARTAAEAAQEAAETAEGAAGGSARASAQSASTARDAAQNAGNAAQEAGNSAAAAAGSASTAESAATAAAGSASTAESAATAAAGSAALAGRNAEKAETAVSHYPKIVSGYWQVWDPENGQYVNTGVKAEGEKGDKGDPGEVTEARLAVALAPYRTAAAQDVIDAAQDAKLEVLRPAASAQDVGKALIVKTVADGEATAYEFGEAGGGGDVTTEQWLYSFPTGQASGAPASFDDGGDDLPIRALSVDIALNQSGSGDPAPDNVRPITGWTGLTLSRSGEDTSAPDTYAVTFSDPATGDPLTVYGGKLMIHADGSGELVSSYRAVMLDSLNYNTGLASSGVFRATLSGLEEIAAGTPSLLFCTKYKTVAAATASAASDRADYSVFQRSGYNQIYVKDTNCINYTAAQFKEYVSGVLLYYQLAEDAVYPLSPGQVDALRVNTLRGTNNIWADTGNVSVEYRADPGLFAAQSGGAVQSVNGKTGAVTLDAGDVGALPDGALAPYRTAAAQDVIDSGKLDAPSAAGTSGQLLGLDGQGKPVWEDRDKSVTVPGTAPTITAASNTRYVCGEVTTLSFTPPASGVCDVIFTSGTTATVLTVPSTVKWANGFDPQSLDANTTYELNICDGLGVAAAWT